MLSPSPHQKSLLVFTKELSPPQIIALTVSSSVRRTTHKKQQATNKERDKQTRAPSCALHACMRTHTHSPVPDITHRFLVAVEDRYMDNPYHNRMHAADVLRTLHVIMTRGGVRQAMHAAHDIALLSAYVAAVVHDFEHKGTCDLVCWFVRLRAPVCCKCVGEAH